MTVPNRWDLHSLIGSYRRHQRRTRGLREPTLYTYYERPGMADHLRALMLDALEMAVAQRRP